MTAIRYLDAHQLRSCWVAVCVQGVLHWRQHLSARPYDSHMLKTAVTTYASAPKCMSPTPQQLASGLQSDLDSGVDAPLPAVDLDILLLPPPSFPPAPEPSQAPLQAAQAGPGPPQQHQDAQMLSAAAPPPASPPGQQSGAQQQPHYQLRPHQMHAVTQQHPQQQYQQHQQQQMYLHAEHGQHFTVLGGQLAVAAQGGGQRQQHQHQQPPQQLQATHLQNSSQASPHWLQPAGSSEGIAPSLAAPGGSLEVSQHHACEAVPKV